MKKLSLTILFLLATKTTLVYALSALSLDGESSTILKATKDYSASDVTLL